MNEKILGYTWDEIQRMQQRGTASRPIDTARKGDYGADPLTDGTFRMVPSGDIVDLAERNRRLAK